MTFSKLRMTSAKCAMPWRWLAFAATALAALAPVAAARADAQYQADRAYCTSGQASEARSLCLKEAAAAQAEREKSSRHAAGHSAAKGAKKDASAVAAKSASAS